MVEPVTISESFLLYGFVFQRIVLCVVLILGVWGLKLGGSSGGDGKGDLRGRESTIDGERRRWGRRIEHGV